MGQQKQQEHRRRERKLIARDRSFLLSHHDTITSSSSAFPPMSPQLVSSSSLTILPIRTQSPSKSSINITKVTSSHRVRFNTKRLVRKSLSRKDYTPTEIENTWYSQNELDTIWLKCKETIHKVHHRRRSKQHHRQPQLQQQERNRGVAHSTNNIFDDEDLDDPIDYYGLEKYILPQVINKKKFRQQAAMAVFTEQKLNMRNNSGTISRNDTGSCSLEKRIAFAYYYISYPCQLLARDIGIRDQNDAFRLNFFPTKERNRRIHE